MQNEGSQSNHNSPALHIDVLGELTGQLHTGRPVRLPRRSSGPSGSHWASDEGGQCALDSLPARMREGVVRVDPTRGLAWPHKEGSSPCCRGMPCAQKAKRRGIGFQRRRGCQGERQDAALFSLARPGKWDVASGVRRGAGAPRPGCAMGSGCLF